MGFNNLGGFFDTYSGSTVARLGFTYSKAKPNDARYLAWRLVTPLLDRHDDDDPLGR